MLDESADSWTPPPDILYTGNPDFTGSLCVILSNHLQRFIIQFVEHKLSFILSSNTCSEALQRLLNLAKLYWAIYKTGVIISVSFVCS